jgi:hypothetical protein
LKLELEIFDGMENLWKTSRRLVFNIFSPPDQNGPGERKIGGEKELLHCKYVICIT